LLCGVCSTSSFAVILCGLSSRLLHAGSLLVGEGRVGGIMN